MNEYKSEGLVSVWLPHHAPPQRISVAGEARLALLVHGILLGKVDEVGGEDQAQEADVQGGDQLLEHRSSRTFL